MQNASTITAAFKRMTLAEKASLLASLLNDCDIMDSDEGYALFEAGEAFYSYATADTEAVRAIAMTDAILTACDPYITEFEDEGRLLDREADEAFARRHGVAA